MRPLSRTAAAILVCSALSTAALADPVADPVKPAPVPNGASVTLAPKHVGPVLSHAARVKLALRRAAERRRLAAIHHRAPIQVASLAVVPPPRPARLVDMTAQRDGIVVARDTVQIAKPIAQNSACDSLLCSSYIILGAGF